MNCEVRRHLPGGDRPSGREAGHPRKGTLAGTPLPVGPVHQPASVKTLSRGGDAAQRQGGRPTSTLSCVRENTEDMYCGTGGFLKKNTPDEVATQTAVYTRKGCERCIRWAFEFTRKRNNPKKMLTLVAKTKVC